ncbi:MAG: HyaD/HybD family hydrogenase maturation endopeptidase [Gammaproteobacteria bacterium]|nr:HyaD/HybD family hydrogenase maturation endopeptidase [Gammaproteobacteria bacterium]MBU1653571.1 HyaD/HybD family hydrogenase maturation endopeptidase [Gammaproteobacteria bacterium]MBU1961913.1 HyaD/HybD family hydrogenase maturation endopeptidase [Gammaproteobacteria bacterium]
MITTLFLGIGNTLLSDEGVGVHVIRYLNEHHPDEPDMTLLDGGTLSFTLAGAIADHRHLIVIDAARLDAPPGTVRTFTGDEMDRFLAGNRASVHEVGLMDLLNISRLSGHVPSRRALIGVQPQSIDWGDSPSAPVAAALPRAASYALELHRQWRKSPVETRGLDYTSAGFD